MPRPPERSRLRLAAQALVAVLVALAAMPMYLVIAPSWRPAAARLACGLLVAMGCVRVIRPLRSRTEDQPTSALDAPAPPSPGPALDERFLRLRDELVFSARSRRHFDAILWPRLLALAGTELSRPAERRGLLRDGPSPGELERLIAEIERRA
jgi:hypothetical protein